MGVHKLLVGLALGKIVSLPLRHPPCPFPMIREDPGRRLELASPLPVSIAILCRTRDFFVRFLARFGICFIASTLAALKTIQATRSLGDRAVLPGRSFDIWRSGSLLLVFTLTPILASPGLARADLHKDLGRLARDIKSILHKRGEKAAAVGQFTGPPSF